MIRIDVSALTALLKTSRWIVYSAFSNLIDVSIVALALALVYNLEMKTTRKAKIVTIFALRLGHVYQTHFPKSSTRS